MQIVQTQSRVTDERSAILARLAALSAVVLWGVSFVATKAALRDLSPVTLIFSRFALGAAVLFLILTVRGERLVPPRHAWPALVLMGCVGVFIHQMLQVHGLALTTAVRNRVADRTHSDLVSRSFCHCARRDVRRTKGLRSSPRNDRRRACRHAGRDFLAGSWAPQH